MNLQTERAAEALRRSRSVAFWKMIASATAGAALAVIGVTTLRDCLDTRSREAAGRAATLSAVAPAEGGAASSDERTSVVENRRGAPAAAASETAEPTTTSATFDGRDDATAGRDAAPVPSLAPPARLAPPAPLEAADAGAPSEGDASLQDAATSRSEVARPDASKPPLDPWAPPSMSAGAGRFSTEAPYWGASAFVPDPNAGAGRFTTDAPPWGASAFTPDPNAGAGPFTTERSLPGFGGGFWPMIVPAPPPVP